MNRIWRMWRRLRYGEKVRIGPQGETVYGPYGSVPTGCRCNQPGDYCHCGGEDYEEWVDRMAACGATAKSRKDPS